MGVGRHHEHEHEHEHDHEHDHKHRGVRYLSSSVVSPFSESELEAHLETIIDSLHTQAKTHVATEDESQAHAQAQKLQIVMA